jgi:hypothetical protein
VHLLSRAEAARNQERIHGRAIVKAVIRQDGQASLCLHRPRGVRDQKDVEFGIESTRNGEDRRP